MTATTTLPVLFSTGIHASRPSASAVGAGGLYSCTTHSLVYQTDGSSWTTWATLSGTGLSDPMTTRGDVIVRNASNVTARLAIGSSGKVLSSDGTDISWQTPSSGLITPSYVSASSDVTGMNSTSLADISGLSTSITTGATRILCTFSGTFNRTAGAGGIALSVDIGGTQIGTVPWAYSDNAGYVPVYFQVMSAVQSAGAHTVKVRYKADNTTTWTLLGSGGTGVGNLFTVIETSLAT